MHAVMFFFLFRDFYRQSYAQKKRHAAGKDSLLFAVVGLGKFEAGFVLQVGESWEQGSIRCRKVTTMYMGKNVVKIAVSDCKSETDLN